MDTRKKIKVLIVEDEAITAMAIKRNLEELGYSVPAIADTGEEAISLADKIKPNLILMDIVLKGKMDGTEAAERISNSHQIPIIFLTAYNDMDTINRAKTSAPYAYLSKPIDERHLDITVDFVLLKHDAAMKISAAERRYHSVMQNATCGILILNTEGVICELNKNAEKILGYSNPDDRQYNIKKFISESQIDYFNIQMKKIFSEKFIETIELTVGNLNGNVLDIEFSAIYIDHTGHDFIFCILNDVTEIKKQRMQTLLQDKLATIGTLTAGILHEINNPLTFVLTNLHFIDEQLKLLHPDYINQNSFMPKLSEIIGESIYGADRIKKIVSDLKEFARFEKNELTLVNVNDVIDKAVEISYPQYKHYAKLIKEYTADLPQILLTSGKLQQVFINLIINSAQAMNKNNFQNNLITIRTYLNKNNIGIDIIDNGNGILPEHLSKIFVPFFTTKPIGMGTGLGLSICYQIIHELGGQIFVSSTIGKGSKFTINLSLDQA